MLDVIHLVRRDHRKLQVLFEGYMTTETGPALAAAACTELLIHMAGEEEVLYPFVESELLGGPWLVRENLKQHRWLTEAIAELDRLGYDHPEADELMRDIIAVATTHIDETEQELLLDVKAALTLEELAELGSAFADDRALREAYLRLEHTVPESKAELGTPEPEPRAIDAEDTAELGALTRRELYELAAEKGVAGRSRMNRDELIDALAER